jgi:peptidoglycan/LPS O-acetylase OafA/YrhL
VARALVMSKAAGYPDRRWHDLDALRAFAMLLGIGLHAALSFYPSAWPVQDVTAAGEGPFDELVLAIHGFRMPLFFVLSGFFTALLWQRRGLGALLGHRVRRIALPFLLGLLVIVPTVDWVAEQAVKDQLADAGELGSAVYLGYEDTVRSMLDAGADPDAPGGDGAYAPLYLAAVQGDAGMAELLLAHGADPDLAGPDGRAVDAAAYFGQMHVAELLIAAGATDPRDGGSWDDLPYWALGAGTDGSAAAAGDGSTGLLDLLPNLHHLWFLWFLIIFVALFAPLAWVTDRWRQRDDHSTPRRWVGWAMWLLIPLVWLPQLAMEGGETIPAFGPDTSIGWVPLPQVLAYYGLFFVFGILLFGRPDRSGSPLVDSIGDRWWLILPLAALVLIIGISVTFDQGQAARPLASALQVAYAWLMVFGLIGLFRALLSSERHAVRYLSDGSYWMYLVHVTLVIALQAWVRTWDIAPGLKLALIVGLAFALLLLTYRYLVRYTAIGSLLNGKRLRATTPALRARATSSGAS